MVKRTCYFIVLLMAGAFMACSIVSCNKDKGRGYDWEWDRDSTANSDKPRLLWIDAAANFPDYANSKDNILRDLKLAKETGFTGIVVDVRPTTGDALFKTKVVGQVKWLGAWLPSGYTRIDRTTTWDYLQAFIDAAQTVGLKVYASINTFSGGNTTALGSDGVLFRDADKREWATDLLTSSGITNTMDINVNGAKFFNPVNEEVQDYVCDMLDDLAAYKGLDGILLDRGRFDNLYSDFSNDTKAKFEAFLGHAVQDFPAAVMTPDIRAGNLPATLPVYFKEWLEFRVKVIHDFMKKARDRVKAINPDIDFGVYVGGWYSTYYEVGVNWASPRYNTAGAYSKWASAGYMNYGFADLMDVILIGAYASPTSIYGTGEWTVQGFCSRAVDLIKGDAPVIGGTDIGNGDWATSSDAVVNQAIINSIGTIMNTSDGYFLFDMIDLKHMQKWDAARQGIDAAIQ
jgi:uncharacterized lipoprotein YddW (UPF0748 family)